MRRIADREKADTSIRDSEGKTAAERVAVKPESETLRRLLGGEDKKPAK